MTLADWDRMVVAELKRQVPWYDRHFVVRLLPLRP